LLRCPMLLLVYVDQNGYERNTPTTFAALVAGFTDYQSAAP